MDTKHHSFRSYKALHSFTQQIFMKHPTISRLHHGKDSAMTKAESLFLMELHCSWKQTIASKQIFTIFSGYLITSSKQPHGRYYKFILHMHKH